jgi:hypothetical protein
VLPRQPWDPPERALTSLLTFSRRSFASIRPKPLKRLVPGEGFEPPTFGLQTRRSPETSIDSV